MFKLFLFLFAVVLIITTLVHIHDMWTYELELHKLRKAVKQAGEAHEQEHPKEAGN